MQVEWKLSNLEVISPPHFMGGSELDVLIDKGRIVDIGHFPEVAALQTLSVTGAILCPGFIDTHTHLDVQVLVHPECAPQLRQGTTTVCVGLCGKSVFPISKTWEHERKQLLEPVMGPSLLDFHPSSCTEYFHVLELIGPGVNVASFVGHNSVRLAVMGYSKRPASPDEIAEMKELIVASFEAGALGLSFGLLYAPGAFASKSELRELCVLANQYSRPCIFHIRNEGNTLLQSVQEVLDIADGLESNFVITHHKASGKRNWGKVQQTLELLDSGIIRGENVYFNVYPYTAGATNIATLFPLEYFDQGLAGLTAYISDSRYRRAIRDKIENGLDWENLIFSAGWENIQINGNKCDPRINGKRLSELPDFFGGDNCDALFDFVVATEGQASIIVHDMCEQDICFLLQHSRCMIASDSFVGVGVPHPRMYGTFPRIFSRFVKELKTISIQDAIMKMSYDPSNIFAIKSRGTIQPGNFADLVVFDRETIRDTATYDSPTTYPEGIKAVFVNGVLAIRDKKVGASNGYVIRES